LALSGAGIAAACSPSARAPSAPASGNTEEERQWAELVKAAREEGSLNLVTVVGEGYRTALDQFETAFGLKSEHTSLAATSFVPKALQEASAGIYSYDVITSSHTTATPRLYKEGRMDAIRPVIFRSDVLDDKVWRDGYEAGYLDEDRKWMYSAFEQTNRSVWVNTDLVKEGEVTSLNDLLDPKWKGKILGGDPRGAGSGGNPATMLRLLYGDDIIKRLWKDQEVTLGRDERQMTESMARGRFPIGIGAVNENVLNDFLQNGVGKNLKPVDIPEINRVANGGGDAVFLFKNAPHPNAAKLFINWMLTKEGQVIWSQAAKNNSRRVDVAPAAPENMLVPGRQYVNMHDYRNGPLLGQTYEIAAKILN
jgi:iron(III) transport system substrate-binding protein